MRKNMRDCVKLVMLLAYSIFAVSETSAQLKNTKRFFGRNSELTQCTGEYILDSLGNFFEISGCEGKNTVYMGVYQLTRDTLHFIYKVPKDFPPVLRIDESLAENDSLIKITLLSCLGNPVPIGFNVDAIETNGRFFKECVVNEKGEIFLNPYKYASLRLTELDHYYGKWSSVDIKHANQKIILGFPEDFFELSHPAVWFLPRSSALLKDNGLYDFAEKMLYYESKK